MPKDHVYPSGHKTPKEKQMKVLVALAKVGPDGLTPHEMAEIEDPGNVSAMNMWGSAFTNLRKGKEIVGLQESRLGHHVYVLKPWVKGRQIWKGYGHHCKTCSCPPEEK
jgi:hypothetical protein